MTYAGRMIGLDIDLDSWHLTITIKGLSDERTSYDPYVTPLCLQGTETTASLQLNPSSRETLLMRGQHFYCKRTLYTVKPVFKGHSDEMTPSIQ